MTSELDAGAGDEDVETCISHALKTRNLKTHQYKT